MRTHNYSHSHFTEEGTGRIQEAVQGHPVRELQDGNPTRARLTGGLISHSLFVFLAFLILTQGLLM